MLLSMDNTFADLLDAIFDKGIYIHDIPNLKISIGQGLNLSKDYLVDLNFIEN